MCVILFQMLSQLLGLPKSEVEQIMEQLAQSEPMINTEETGRHVTFDVDTMSVTSFMKSFLCQPHLTTDSESSRSGSLSVDKRLSEENRLNLGNIFHITLNSKRYMLSNLH